ncbi:MAG: hypothetical protein QF745_10995, partial [Planctomycetota bacterium]|nr:hypothetical protein [Planctomycetota bacterium]
KKKKATSVDEPTKKKKKKKTASPSEEDDEEPTSPTRPIAKTTKKLGSGKAAAIGTATRAGGRNAAEAEAQDQGLPIGSMMLALWSLILFCAIGYWFLFMKDEGGEEGETNGVNLAQPTVATTSIPKTGGGQIKPLKLAKLENAEERVEEFMEFALEQIANRGTKSVRIVSGGVNRIFYRLYTQVKQETSRDFDQGNCFDALSKVVSLHDNHAETRKQKEAAQFYFAVVVKQFDKKFASESRAIIAKVRNDQLDAARKAYKDLGDRFGTSRWKEKAQARIARLDQLEEIRSSDGSKDAVAAASAFKGLIGKAASRATLRRFDHAKAATAFEGLIKDAPNAELKALAKTQFDAYKLQAEGFERAAQNVTADAKNKGIKFSEGRIKNADVVGAKPDQLTLKIRGRDGGQIETSIRFVKIEPDRLQETLRKFKLDPQATAGLYVFCVENDLADPAEELKEIALEEGDDAFKESFSAFVEAHS